MYALVLCSVDKYILFDFPGQVELYTHEQSISNILQKMQKLEYRLSVVHLVDAHHCTDSAKFISVVLLSLSSMVRLEVPHVNVLSKVDLMQQYGRLGTSSRPFLWRLDGLSWCLLGKQRSTWTSTRTCWICATCWTAWMSPRKATRSLWSQSSRRSLMRVSAA